MKPPIGGWNSRDEPGQMAPTDAGDLINLIPRPGYVEMRGGVEEHALVQSKTGAQTDTTNYFDGGDIAAFDFGASADFSVEVYMKHSGGGQAAKTVLGKRNGALGGWALTFEETNENVSFRIHDGTNTVLATMTDACPNDGEWHHIAFTVDRTGDQMRGYFDAMEASNSPYDISTVTGSLDASTAPFRVFDNSAATSHWDNGLVTDVRVWDDVRTADEIRDNYNTELAGTEPNLIGYWKMQGTVNASVTTIPDDSPNSNTLTDTGGGDITFIDASGAFERELDIDLCVEYYDGTTRQLIAASPSNLFNATASPATSIGSGFTNGRWDTATMDGIMVFVNGADQPQQWDGTTLSSLTITGPTATNIIGVHIFKARAYYWEDNSQSFWYTTPNTLNGTPAEFELGQIAKKGGRLLRMDSWTVDGGAGPDDYAVFVMDTGEVIVYQGDNPGDSAAWGLVGIYDVGRPINDRAFQQLGGQLAMITETDLVTMPSAFNTASPPPTKLSSAIADAVAAFGSNPGWEIFRYPNEHLAMINVPVALSPDTFEQYVIELRTGAAARFTNINARTWGLYDGNPYFGGTTGKIYRFNNNTSDLGANIDCEAQMAWTDFNIPENKTVTSVRNMFEAESTLTFDTAFSYDFVEERASSPSSSSTGGTPWGSSWGSPWSSPTSIQGEWMVQTGRGSHVSMNLRFSRQGDQPRWLRTDMLVRVGGNF